jgi:cell cycle checkpoint protein
LETLTQYIIFKLVTVTLKTTGIKFSVEEARTVQGSAFLQKDLWAEYHYNSEQDQRFTINLTVLLECLNIYGPVVPQQSNPPLLQVAYRGYGTPLLVMLEANEVLTDCALRTLEAEPLMLFNLRSADILCKLIVKTEFLKEAFNELDWSNLSCTWLVSEEHPYFRLSTDGTGASCQVDYPRESEVFEVFECSKFCEFKYKMKHMHPCAKALSIAQKSQIRINAQGLLSMQHRIQNEDSSVSYVEFYLVPLEVDDEGNHRMDV